MADRIGLNRLIDSDTNPTKRKMQVNNLFAAHFAL